MMTVKQLRKFWSLAKKAIGDEKEVREWLFRQFGVFSPHDLKESDRQAVFAYLEEAEKDYYMSNHPNNPLLDELLMDWLRERNFKLKMKGKDGWEGHHLVTQEDIELLKKVLHYFTPCMASELKFLLAQIEYFTLRIHWTAVKTVLQMFLEHTQKVRRTYSFEKLPPRYLLRLLRGRLGREKRVWQKWIQEEIDKRLAKEVVDAFVRMTEKTMATMYVKRVNEGDLQRRRPA